MPGNESKSIGCAASVALANGVQDCGLINREDGTARLPPRLHMPPGQLKSDLDNLATYKGSIERLEEEMSARLRAIEVIVGHVMIVDTKIDTLTQKLDVLAPPVRGRRSGRRNILLHHGQVLNPLDQITPSPDDKRSRSKELSTNFVPDPVVLVNEGEPSQLPRLDVALASISDDINRHDGHGVSPKTVETNSGCSNVTQLVHRGDPDLVEYTSEAIPIPSEHSGASVGNWLEQKYRSRPASFEIIWFFFEEPESSRLAWIYNIMMQSFLGIAFLFTVLQWCEAVDDKRLATIIAETVIDGVFMVELLLRFVVCPSRATFLKLPYNWIDAFSAMPLFLRLLYMHVQDEHIRMRVFFHAWEGSMYTAIVEPLFLGVVPVIRLLKYLRRFQKFNLLLRAFKLACEALDVLLFIYLLIVLAFATLLYIVEPREISIGVPHIDTFPAAMKLAIVTLTTLGYGDVVPLTTSGNALMAVFVVVGMIYMAVPVGIIGNSFHEVWQDRDRYLLMERTRSRVSQCGYAPSDIPRLFQLFDLNQDGSLDLDEFDYMVRGLRLGINQARIEKLFDVLDDDGSGSIDAKEFVHAVFPQYFHSVYGE